MVVYNFCHSPILCSYFPGLFLYVFTLQRSLSAGFFITRYHSCVCITPPYRINVIHCTTPPYSYWVWDPYSTGVTPSYTEYAINATVGYYDTFLFVCVCSTPPYRINVAHCTIYSPYSLEYGIIIVLVYDTRSYCYYSPILTEYGIFIVTVTPAHRVCDQRNCVCVSLPHMGSTRYTGTIHRTVCTSSLRNVLCVSTPTLVHHSSVLKYRILVSHCCQR